MTEEERKPWPELRSYEQAQTVLRRAYVQQGFILPADVTPGAVVADEFAVEVQSLKFAALFCLVDEMIALLRFFGFGLLLTAVGPREDAATDAAIYHRVCAKAVANLVSIRALCIFGLDGNAKLQLRLHYETMVLWSRLRIDAAAMAVFAAVDSFEASNRFWREHLAFQKSEKYIAAAVGSTGTAWPGFSEAHQEFVSPILGASSHPSNVEMSMNAQDDWFSVPQDRYIRRDVSKASHMTLTSAIWMCSFPFMLGGLRLHEIYPPDGWHPPESRVLACEDPAADYYAALQKMILLLYVVAQPFSASLRSELAD